MTDPADRSGRLPDPDRIVELEFGPYRLRCAAFGPEEQPPIVLLHGIYAGAHG